MHVLSAVAAAAALLLAGCADDSGPGSEPVPTVEPEPSIEPTPTPTTVPKPIGPGELVGTPEPGVEAGCWLLDGYLLLGADEDLLGTGQPIRVTGHVERDLATTCQQGIPFQVETTSPAE